MINCEFRGESRTCCLEITHTIGKTIEIFSNKSRLPRKLYHLQKSVITTDYKLLYEKVMGLDPKIRFATIFDMDGKVMFSGHREGVENLLTPEESQKSMQLAINAWKSRNEVSSKIGKGKYALVEYEKLKRITMPLDLEHILYITTDVEADHAPIIYRALRLKQDMLHSPSGMP